MGGRLYLRSLHVESGSVVIVVESDQFKSSIVFDHYIAVRFASETFRIASVPELVSFGSRLLEATESEFIDWARREGHGMEGKHTIIHTVILTADDIIEVLAFEPAGIRDGPPT